jgi:peptidoglycan/LPS O-acetylase OafA/YrhL
MQGHKRNGGFDTLRLVAALLVFHSHAFALAGLAEPQIPGGFSFGGFAVTIFFTMSGYWVSRSALERSLPSYAAARALRIFPGLFVCCLATIGLCALATSHIVNDYLRERDTWRWLQNAFPFFLPQPASLPGVFEDGAIHHPNGSLWTLPYEVLCYVLAAMGAVFGPKGMRFLVIAYGVFAAIVVAAMAHAGPPAPVQLTDLFYPQWLALYGGAFFLGAALNGADDRTLLKLAVVAGLLTALTAQEHWLQMAAAVPLYGTLAIWVGRNVDLDRLVTRGQDISYGVYIYAFPCEQLAVRALPPHDLPSFGLYYAAALAATVVLAALSWALVERPALGAKARLAGVIERGVGRLPFPAMRARPVRAP